MGSVNSTLHHPQEMHGDPSQPQSALLPCRQETRAAPGRVMPQQQELGSLQRLAPPTSGPRSQELQGAGPSAQGALLGGSRSEILGVLMGV